MIEQWQVNSSGSTQVMLDRYSNEHGHGEETEQSHGAALVYTQVETVLGEVLDRLCMTVAMTDLVSHTSDLLDSHRVVQLVMLHYQKVTITRC